MPTTKATMNLQSFTDDPVWSCVGLLGQSMFFARMISQWLISEKLGRSTVPAAFWYLSAIGCLALLAYAIRKNDLVFIIGQGPGLFIYARNIYFLRRQACERP